MYRVFIGLDKPYGYRVYRMFIGVSGAAPPVCFIGRYRGFIWCLSVYRVFIGVSSYIAGVSGYRSTGLPGSTGAIKVMEIVV